MNSCPLFVSVCMLRLAPVFPQMSVHDVCLHASYVHFHVRVYFRLQSSNISSNRREKMLYAAMNLEQDPSFPTAG